MKLVRDRIPEIIRTAGTEPIVRVADPTEMSPLLLDKLREEVGEVIEAVSVEPDRIIDELADVLEVVYALAAHHGLDRDDVERARATKAAQRGAFRVGFVWAGNRTQAAAPFGDDRCVRGPVTTVALPGVA